MLRFNEEMGPSPLSPAYSMSYKTAIQHISLMGWAMQPEFKNFFSGFRTGSDIFGGCGEIKIRLFQPVERVFPVGIGVTEKISQNHIPAVVQGDDSDSVIPL